MSDVTIRRGQLGDVPALTDIYNHYVVETPITFDIEPYTVEQRREWFEGFADTGPYQIFVAERWGSVLGYAATLRYRPKAAYQSSVETSIYIAPDAMGRGLGGRLYQALFDGLRGAPVHRVLAAVTLPNGASIALHHRFDFSEVGVFHEVGFKLGRYWDVAWLEKSL